MTCEICGKKPATVHYTAYENSQPKEMHVCHDCAVEKGILVDASEKDKFSIQDPLINMFGGAEAPASGVGKTQCPSCGLLFSGFRETGRLGCAGCYEAFQVQLRPLLRRIHGNLDHTGKRPEGNSEAASRRDILHQLTKELDLAIAGENYEKAAELRDRIRALREEQEAGK